MPIRFLKKLGSRLLGRRKKEEPSGQDVRALPAADQQGQHSQKKHAPRSEHGGAAHRAHQPRHTHPSTDQRPQDEDRRRHRDSRHSAHEPTPPGKPAQPWSIADFVVEPVPGKSRFHDFGLPEEILHAVHDAGFKYCTPIQAQVMPYAGQLRNIAGQAQTGTGKTAAFLTLMLTRFVRNPRQDSRPGSPRGLILAPTRELVVQIVNDAAVLEKYTGIKTMGVYGGMDYGKQQRALETEVWDIIVATPGRLLDFKGRGRLNLGQIEVLVIDEADRMLDMGFIPDVRRIVRATPPREKRQTLVFSATLSDDVMRLSSEWMVDPVIVKIEPDQVAVQSVRQIVYALSSNEKFTVLWNLLSSPEVTRVLVFANRRVDCERLGDALRGHGINCEVLSGDVPQKKRLRVLEDFKAGVLRVVVATDVAGRGLHVADVSHVVNFDLPYEPEAYVHRIGRTGRAGAAGTAISFACENEAFAIPEIEKLLGEPMTFLQPTEELLRPPPRRAPSASAGHAHGRGEYGGRGPRGPRHGDSHRRGPPSGHGGYRRSSGGHASHGHSRPAPSPTTPPQA